MQKAINYIELDGTGHIIGISMLSGRVDNPSMIEWPIYDLGLIGKKIVDGKAVVSPEWEAARLAAAALAQAKAQAIIDNLPSWAEIDDEITAATTIAGLKIIIRKMARVLYWLAKDKAD